MESPFNSVEILYTSVPFYFSLIRKAATAAGHARLCPVVLHILSHQTAADPLEILTQNLCGLKSVVFHLISSQMTYTVRVVLGDFTEGATTEEMLRECKRVSASKTGQASHAWEKDHHNDNES